MGFTAKVWMGTTNIENIPAIWLKNSYGRLWKFVEESKVILTLFPKWKESSKKCI